MAFSNVQDIYVLVYDNSRDVATWVSPALASLMTLHNPYMEEIYPMATNYHVMEKLAGPMPVTYHRGTE
jgi:hypothetical protein